jgi:hypothetical protein
MQDRGRQDRIIEQAIALARDAAPELAPPGAPCAMSSPARRRRSRLCGAACGGGATAVRRLGVPYRPVEASPAADRLLVLTGLRARHRKVHHAPWPSPESYGKT